MHVLNHIFYYISDLIVLQYTLSDPNSSHSPIIFLLLLNTPIIDDSLFVTTILQKEKVYMFYPKEKR